MFWRCFWKNIDVDVFDDVLQNAKHRANDAYNDVNRPPLGGRGLLDGSDRGLQGTPGQAVDGAGQDLQLHGAVADE